MLLAAIIMLTRPLAAYSECASAEILLNSAVEAPSPFDPMDSNIWQPSNAKPNLDSLGQYDLNKDNPNLRTVRLSRAAADTPSPPAPMGFDILKPSVVKKNHLKAPAASIPRFSFSGSFFERYRNDYNKNNGDIDSQGDVTFGEITGKYEIVNKLWGYLRLAGEGISQGGQGRDMNTDYYPGTHGYRGALAFDQFGIEYENTRKGALVTIGRQGKSLDATSTIYDQSWRVGNRTFLDGISASKRSEKWAFELDAFSEDQYVASGDSGVNARNGLYAARAALELTSKIVEGVTIAKYIASAASSAAGNQTDTSAETDIVWEASDRMECRLEYGKSDADSRNELYFGSAKYRLTKRDSVTAITYKIGQFADLGGGTAYPNNNRGARYFIQHDLSSRTSLILYHEVDHELYGSGSSGSDQMTISYAF
jgi:hypothetical protein